MTKAQKITYYILLVLISLLFIGASIPKLISSPQAIEGFSVAHLPIWFMYFIGVAEIVGVIGLWVRKYAAAAAYCLMIILAGAIITTAIFVSVVEAILPLVAAIILAIVLKLGKKRGAVAIK
jgi:putative oxidoreductase